MSNYLDKLQSTDTMDFFPRTLSDQLKHWLGQPDKRPLLLEGARQVGKTALLTRFGQLNFPKVHLFNFEKQRSLHAIFAADLNPQRILEELEVAVSQSIDPHADFIIFDEIQACESALTSLKYFAEESPGINLAAAGSLIGLYLGEGSFPVGATQRLSLYPLSFTEFLAAAGEQRIAASLQNLSFKKALTPFIADRIWERFLDYLIVGGMPAAIKAWNSANSKLRRIAAVNTAQETILKDYLADITKHCGNENALHIEAVLRNIPEQLARETDGSASKFQFKEVIPKKKSYKELRGPIHWLEKAGLVKRVPIAEKAAQPLSAYCKENRFKLYFFDIGILRCLAHFAPEVIWGWKDNMYKGFFAENFALLELISSGLDPVYAWREGDSEVEFILEVAGQIIPVEVKSGVNRRRRSLQIFQQRYHPEAAYVFAGKGANPRPDRFELPIYAVGQLGRQLSSAGA